MSRANSYQVIIEKVITNFVPLICLFELTFDCNLSCKHCYIVRKKAKKLSKSEVFNILGQLKDMGCLNLIFSGGEIFMRKDFFEIAAYARKLNFAIILYTNGTLIDEKIADRIRELDMLRVEISLYGFKETHDGITQNKSSFDRTIRGIRLLTERKIKVVIKEVLMAQNISEVWNLQKFATEELGVSWKRIGGTTSISPCDDGSKRPLKYRATDEQLREYIKEIIRQYKNKGIDIKWPERTGNRKLCEAGFQLCNISPYGEVNLCSQLRLNKDNSLRDKSFKEIWLEHKEIKKFRNTQIEDRIECRGCELMRYCNVCPGIAFAEKGSMLAKLPEACRTAKMLKEVCA